MTFEHVYPLRLDDLHTTEIKEISTKLNCSKAEAIRQAISFYHNHLQPLQVTEIRWIPKSQAKKEIMKYLKGKPKAYTDEIADKLHLDVAYVDEVLIDLWGSDAIEQVD